MDILFPTILIPALVFVIIDIVVPFTIMVVVMQDGGGYASKFQVKKIHEALMDMMTQEQLDILLKDLDLNSKQSFLKLSLSKAYFWAMSSSLFLNVSDCESSYAH